MNVPNSTTITEAVTELALAQALSDAGVESADDLPDLAVAQLLSKNARHRDAMVKLLNRPELADANVLPVM